MHAFVGHAEERGSTALIDCILLGKSRQGVGHAFGSPTRVGLTGLSHEDLEKFASDHDDGLLGRFHGEQLGLARLKVPLRVIRRYD